MKDLNKQQHQKIQDAETLARIEQYELAYRMQTAVPEVMDISKEPEHILKLYGVKPGFVSKAESADDSRVESSAGV